ncbi:MAG: EamA family transporter [Polaromonas sp. 24-62-144]|nr:MAG: EamA family transporter [Polaromonas sp. 24-62-144]
MNRIVAYACLALSMSLVGSYVALSKSLVAALPVFLLAWLRFGIGGVAMLSWLKKPALFLRERISLRVWGAVACGVLGIALVSLSKQELPAQVSSGLQADLASNNAWLGNLLLVGAVLCEASYAVIGKRLTGVLGPKRITALINLWGFVLVTPLGLWAAWHFDFSGVAPSAWVLLLFYSLAASVWSVWLWMTGLKTIAANRAGVFTVFLPVSAAAVGVAVLGETLTGLQMGAFTIALTGVVLATLPSPGRAATAPDGQAP